MCDTTSQVNPQVVIAPHYFDSAEILIQASSGSQALVHKSFILAKSKLDSAESDCVYSL